MISGETGYALTQRALYRFKREDPANWASVAQCEHLFEYGLAGVSGKYVLMVGGETRPGSPFVTPALFRWDDSATKFSNVGSLPSDVCVFSGDCAMGLCANENGVIVTTDQGKTWSKVTKIFAGDGITTINRLFWLGDKDWLAADTNGNLARLRIENDTVKKLWTADAGEPQSLLGVSNGRAWRFDGKQRLIASDINTGESVILKNMPQYLEQDPQNLRGSMDYLTAWEFLGDWLAVCDGREPAKWQVFEKMGRVVGILETTKKEILVFLSDGKYVRINPDMTVEKPMAITCDNAVFNRAIDPANDPTLGNEAQLKETLELLKKLPPSATDDFANLMLESQKRYKTSHEQMDWVIEELRKRVAQMEAASQPSNTH